jgi:hypothetical protein
MPVIHRLGPFAIRVFTRDHPPVQVHVDAGDFVARVFLDGSVEVIRGKAPAGFGAAVDWVLANRAAITATWDRTRPQ